MAQQTFIICNREFTAMRMNVFAANKILMRLQKVLLPAAGALMGDGKNIGDVDVKQAAMVIAESLDEKTIDTIVLPMLNEARVYSVEDKCFLRTSTDIDKCFKTENLFDFYELIFEVGKFQFGPFLQSLSDRFGGLLGPENQA